MNNNIFRKKSLDRVSSPEDLNNYMRVTNPPVWFALSAIILLLIGAIIWGIFGKIETKVNAVTVSKDGKAVCYVSEQDVSELKENMSVTVDSKDYIISQVAPSPLQAESVLNDYSMHLGDFKNGEYVYAVTLIGDLKDGNYACTIVTEKISAISFLWN